MTDLITWITNFGQHHLDLVALILGTAAGYALGLLTEAYALPTTMPMRKQQGITVLVTVLGSLAMSVCVWTFLDGADSIGMRIAVSLPASLLAPFGYPMVARLATSYWPAIGTVWKLPQ